MNDVPALAQRSPCAFRERAPHQLANDESFRPSRAFHARTYTFAADVVSSKHQTSPLEYSRHSSEKPKTRRTHESGSYGKIVFGSCGPMDKAPVYGTGDSRFDPWQDQLFVGIYFLCQGKYPYEPNVT